MELNDAVAEKVTCCALVLANAVTVICVETINDLTSPFLSFLVFDVKRIDRPIKHNVIGDYCIYHPISYKYSSS